MPEKAPGKLRKTTNIAAKASIKAVIRRMWESCISVTRIATIHDVITTAIMIVVIGILIAGVDRSKISSALKILALLTAFASKSLTLSKQANKHDETEAKRASYALDFLAFVFGLLVVAIELGYLKL